MRDVECVVGVAVYDLVWYGGEFLFEEVIFDQRFEGLRERLLIFLGKRNRVCKDIKVGGRRIYFRKESVGEGNGKNKRVSGN